MPNTFFTRYLLVVNDLKELALDVKDIAQDTAENISEVEAVLAQYYLKQRPESGGVHGHPLAH